MFDEEQSNHSSYRARIYNDILETIGMTPLVRLNKITKEVACRADVVCKCEFFNPLGSVKDRIGLAMIESAEKSGRLKSGDIIVEPTSGNTGIALAFVCAAKGYHLILTMPESMSIERRKMLYLMGAEIRLTPAKQGMGGAIKEAEKIANGNPKALMLQQFSNEANPAVHRDTTAEEIWCDTNGAVDVIVSGVGTGGTITGVAEVLKSRKPELIAVAVEPEDSPVISGGDPGAHQIQGIGPGFIPENLNTDLIDETIQIGNETAFSTARKLAALEGIPVGISSGASVAASLEIGQRSEMSGKLIVAILPSFAERYLSTGLFDGIPQH